MTINFYDLIFQNPHNTVVAEYQPIASEETGFQSEAELEKAFIDDLRKQSYDYLAITGEEELVANLRRQLEKLNSITFSDQEWEQFFSAELANQNQGILEKANTIQSDFKKILTRDDGSVKNIHLLDKDQIHNNHLQVINQYEMEGGRKNRYDVTVLVNGLPLVHVELKRRGVAIREAFNQIERYQRESFWSGSGLFEYVQLFVISNGIHTKYYSNTTRDQHLKEKAREITSSRGGRGSGRKRSGHSFEFTSWWADANNRPIMDLMDFVKTFFAKHTLLNILTRFCVFTESRELLAMRPYQIVATERIINTIKVSTQYKKMGTVEAGGYIWHTTGSGKTLTSFKTAQLASSLPDIDKVLFVVDRKDLDEQTMREYEKFQKGAANGNTSTQALKKQLDDPNANIIITTIQKLSRFVKSTKEHPVHKQSVVIIFDECHRSQFGEMHRAITKSFKKYYLFGFTGTPIFKGNASAAKFKHLTTTDQAFGKKLHTYTIVDAIRDNNVLGFKVDYVSTFHKTKEAEEAEDKKVPDIDRERALADPRRIANTVGYIREHFDQKTKRKSRYEYEKRQLHGFNSILAVSSIDMAKRYYLEFKKQLQGESEDKQLKVATIFSFVVNEEVDGMVDESLEDTSSLDASSRDFLEEAIKDYNALFGTSYDTSSDKFQNYYTDVSGRVKSREVDILIVVNMFLTGFDAPTLNTLWVDKKLRMHGLLQAFSRTNRILNNIKTFGNIVCFRKLKKATDEAIALFGDKEAVGIVLLKTFEEYYYGYREGDEKVKGYESLVKELLTQFPISPISGEGIVGEEKERAFIQLYNAVLKLHNILLTFDDFEDQQILTEREIQNYHSIYNDLYTKYRKQTEVEKEVINDDLVFEMELIKQIDIGIDYILEQVKLHIKDDKEDRGNLANIELAINSSMELRNKKELINQFIASLDPRASVDERWTNFVREKRAQDLEKIIAEENLHQELTLKFIRNAFLDGGITTSGTAFSEILPPISIFYDTEKHIAKRETVIKKLTDFFDRYYDISSRDI